MKPPASNLPTTPTGQYIREVVLTHDSDDCLIWPFQLNQHGYPVIAYYKPTGERSTTTATRIVLEQVAGPAPSPEHQAAHAPLVCNTRSCVSPRHLRWSTRVENAADQVIDGNDRLSRGRGRPWAGLMGELTPDVDAYAAHHGITRSAAIRRLIAEGLQP